MRHLLSRLPSRLRWSMWLLSAPLLLPMGGPLYAAEQPAQPPLFTVNFNNVSVRQFIRFVSRATGQNFIFEDDNFDFPVTIISEDPTDAQNLMTALIQILRTQGFMLIQQGDNLLIHRSPDVSQVAQVLGEGETLEGEQPGLITRVFRLSSTSPAAILPVLAPLVSKSARIDPSPETNQIIVTDVSANVEKIGQLITAIDTPNSLLRVTTFSSSTPLSSAQISMARELLAPLAEKGVFLLEAQPNSNLVFILATPFLAEQAKEVLQAIGDGTALSVEGEPFLYMAQTQSAATLLDGLQEMLKGLQSKGVQHTPMAEAIASAQLVPSSNGIFFMAPASAKVRLQELLEQLDRPSTEKGGVNSLLYRPKHYPVATFEDLVSHLASALDSHAGDKEISQILTHAVKIGEEGLLFSGPTHSLERVRTLLQDLDSGTSLPVEEAGTAVIIPIEHTTPQALLVNLKEIAGALKQEDDSDEALFRVIDSAKPLSASHALLVSGPPSSIRAVEAYVRQLDVPMAPPAAQVATTSISVVGRSPAEAKQLLEQLFQNLQLGGAQEAAVLQSIRSAQVIPGSQTLVFSGGGSVLEQIRQMLNTLNGTGQAAQVWIYQPKQTDLSAFEQGISDLVKQLESAQHPNEELITALKGGRVISATHSMVFTAAPEVLEQLKAVMPQIDHAEGGPGKSQFWVAQTEPGKAQEFAHQLLDFANELAASGLSNPALLQSLRSARPVDGGKGLVFAGDSDTIAAVQEIVREAEGRHKDSKAPMDEPLSAELWMYQPRHASLSGLQHSVTALIQQLKDAAHPDTALIATLESARPLEGANSLLFSGPEEILNKAKTLVTQMDSAESTPQNTSYWIAPTAHAEELAKQLNNFVNQLEQTGLHDPSLTQAIRTGRPIEGDKGLAFSADPATIGRIREIVEQITPVGPPGSPAPRGALWVYRPKNTSALQIEHGVEAMEAELKKVPETDPALLAALSSVRAIPVTNTVLFTVPASLQKELETLVEQLDTTTTQPQNTEFWVARTGDAKALATQLDAFVTQLQGAGLSDPVLSRAVRAARPVDDNKGLAFSADHTTLERIQGIVQQLSASVEPGQPAPRGILWVFHPEHTTAAAIEHGIQALLREMEQIPETDPLLLAGLKSARVVPATNTVLFTIVPAAQAQIEKLVKQLDLPEGAGPTQDAFWIAPTADGSAASVAKQLRTLADQLAATGLTDHSLLAALRAAQPVDEGKGLAFSTSAKTLPALKEIVGQALQAEEKDEVGKPSALWVYALKSIRPAAFQQSVEQLIQELEAMRMPDSALVAALQSARVMPGTSSVMFKVPPGEEAQLKTLLEQIDVPQAVSKNTQFWIAETPGGKAQELRGKLQHFADQLEASGLSNSELLEAIRQAQPVDQNNGLTFAGDAETLKTIQQMVDQAQQAGQTQVTYYRAEHVGADLLKENLLHFLDDMRLTDPAYSGLKGAAQGLVVLPGNHSLALSGSPAQLSQLQALLQQLDVVPPAGDQVRLYPVPADVNPKEVLAAIDQMADAVKGDTTLQQVLRSRQYLSQSNALSFTGPPKLLATLPDLLKQVGFDQLEKRETLTYTPSNLSPDAMLQAIQETESSLSRSGAPYGLLQSLESARLIGPSKTLVLQVVAGQREPIQQLLSEIDGTRPTGTSIELIAIPAGVSPEEYLHAVDSMAKQVAQGSTPDAGLEEALRSRQIIGNSRTVAFTGVPAALKQVEALLGRLHLPTEDAQLSTYSYRPLRLSPQAMAEALRNTAQSISSTGGDASLAKALNNVHVVAQAHTVLMQVPQGLLPTVKQIVADLDQDRAPGSTFFFYTLRETTHTQIAQHLQKIAADLKQKNQTLDTEVASSIENAEYVTASNSLLFTGSAEVIARLERLVPQLDVPPSGPGGQSQLYVYHVAKGQLGHVEAGLEALAQTLNLDNPADLALSNTLKDKRLLPDGSTLLFTGTPTVLARLQSALQRLDGSAQVGPQMPTASEYLIYRLQSASAGNVEQELRALAAGLEASGLDDPTFFRAIADMQVDPNRNALIFAGPAATLSQLEPLVAVYDTSPSAPTSTGHAVIEPVANTSFMIYKLRYMQGNEIENTLRQMGADLMKVKTKINESLVHAISTMQWIQSSNSLCFSGEPDTLEKLRALISNIDQPARQVFIEVLVLETSLSNSFNFSLDWAGIGQVAPNFALGMSNLPPATGANGFLEQVGNTGIQQPSMTRPVGTQGGVPILANSGWSLGAIGNIVRHNDKTFFDLGSLVQALETESNTTVVLNPKLIGQDSMTSQIFVGQTLGFITQQTQVFSNSTSNATTIDYRQIGTQLQITPIISGDVVTLEIDQMFVQVQEGFQPTAGGSDSGSVPTGAGAFPTQTLHCVTRAHVPDQTILCISGLVNRTRAASTAQVPCLGGLPLIGALFSSNSNQDSRQQVLIFVKPYILSSIEDMQAITQAGAKGLKAASCDSDTTIQNAFNSVSYTKIPPPEADQVPCLDTAPPAR